jgi:hypothetical protein
MNAYQLVKLGAFQANAVKQDGTLAPFFTLPELMAWLNDGNWELEKSLRSIYNDWFVKVMNSQTDTTAQKLNGIDYNPSVSLKLPASTPRITLPPDFSQLRSLRVVTQGFEFMEFQAQDVGSNIFQEYIRVPNAYTTPPGGRIYYHIIADRTLYITPMLNADVDLEMVYVARPKMLVNYNTGTISVLDQQVAVTGVGTAWHAGSPLDDAFLDLMVGTATFSSVSPAWDYDGVNLMRVASINSDTSLTLASAKVGAVAGNSYILSSIPSIPPEHHAALADYVTAQMFGKAGNQAQCDRYRSKFEARKATILNTINDRQPDTTYVEDYTTWS